ncbi:uncharacterized protein LOC108682201 isoform X2 [Hyalella azteca]|uniref:Uncharacterized protein LOC108682201 isoform X2 n=1 Tax=Hyalella azteca TaxID=294128 RepID=A0A8B7PKV8_HYAAZ|nr:uncharacterized protein LOC108682201 isoform X2 [Hyalella azteca]
MDDLYDPAEIYDEENGDANDNFMQCDDDEVQIINEEDDDLDSINKRFSRTEGSEKKLDVLDRLSPRMFTGNESSCSFSSQKHVHSGCVFRLVIFNIPDCVIVDEVYQAVQSVLDEEAKAEFVDGIYGKAAVVCIKPVSGVDKAAGLLKSIANFPVVVRKMTPKDHDIFLRKKQKASKEPKPPASGRVANEQSGSSASKLLRTKDAAVVVKISNVAHSISEESLLNILQEKVDGIQKLILSRPPYPCKPGQKHMGKGKVFFQDKAQAEKFFSLHRMRIAGREIVIDQSKIPAGKSTGVSNRNSVASSSHKEHRLKISNLSVEVSAQELQEIFSGEVNGRVRVNLGKSSDAPHSGTGELIFETAELAKIAHELMDGCDLGGTKIHLELDTNENEMPDLNVNEKKSDWTKENSSGKTENIDMKQRESERERENREKRRLEREMDKPSSRERERLSSRDRERLSSRDRDRLSSRDRERLSSRDRERLSSRDRERRSSRDRERLSSRDRERQSSRGSQGRSQNNRVARSSVHRDRSRDRSSDRSRSTTAGEADYRRYRLVHIYPDAAQFRTRSAGPDTVLQFSNIAYNLPEEKLIDFVLEKCSGLELLHYERNRFGAFQGIAMLGFKTRYFAVAALKLRNTLLDGRKVVVKIDIHCPRPAADAFVPPNPSGVVRPHQDRDMQGPMGMEMMLQGPMSHNVGLNMGPEQHNGLLVGPEAQRPLLGMGPMGGPGLQMGVAMMGDGIRDPMKQSMQGHVTGFNEDGRSGLMPNPINQGSFGGPILDPLRNENRNLTEMRSGFDRGDPMRGGNGDMRGQDDRFFRGSDARLDGPIGRAGVDDMMNSNTRSRHPNAQDPQAMGAGGCVDVSTETYGLAPAFLASLNITLPLTKEVLVMNIDSTATKDDLKELFSIAGTVVAIQYNNGQAIVEMSHPVEAVQSISMLHQQEYFDRIIAVKMLRPNDPDNLVTRAVVAAVPRGLKTIGRGLGLGGMPVAAVTPPAPITPAPRQNNAGSIAPTIHSRMQEQNQARSLAMKAGRNANKRGSHASRWDNDDARQSKDSGDNRSVHNQNPPNSRDVPLGVNMGGQRGHFQSNDSPRPDISPRFGGSSLDGRRFDNERSGSFQPAQGMFPTPQRSLHSPADSFPRPQDSLLGKPDRNFPPRGSFDGRQDLSRAEPRTMDGFRNNAGPQRGGRGANSPKKHMNSGSGRGRGLITPRRCAGFDLGSQRSNENTTAFGQNASTASGKLVILTNLPMHATKQAVNEICSPYGLVKNIELDSVKRACKVTFENYQQATMATDILNNQDFIGSTISATLV